MGLRFQLYTPAVQQLNWTKSSTSGTADASGNLLSTLSYTAFGETRFASGSTSTDYRYTGQREEAELGLYFYNARWYDPSLGRFIQPDTIVPDPGSPMDWDRYAYVRNNPVTLTDPSGEFVSPIVAIAIGGFAAGAVYDAYRQTDGFTDFCQYDILQTLVAGAGGAAAASIAAVMLVSGVGMVGMGLQGVALGLSSIGTSTGAATSLFIAGTTTVSWAGLVMAWLFSSLQFPENSKAIQNPMSRLPIRNNRSDKTSGILIVDSEEIL